MKPLIERKNKNGFWGDAWCRLKKNKGAMFALAIILIMIFCAVFADRLAPYPYDLQDYNHTFETPNRQHLLGTDNFGRDILSRIIHGSRISLLVGFSSIIVAIILGGLLGAVSGYYGGRVDNLFMRAMDILMAIPGMLLAISLAAVLKPGLLNLVIAIAVADIPGYARVVRASVLSIKDQEFIEAAQCVGASDSRIIFKHIIPNCLAPIIVQATLGMAGAILSASSLSFLGLGIQPPTPEWGSMLSSARQYIMSYSHMTTFPGIAIMITIFGLNILGDGLRDALDPRLKN
ncbi:ABC transporter permease [Sedimentibacter hydroxybenzoicus DSM 7310]|uniref:ABC transporter permease n=1 Tax=Sedimentibacter hydroxybenzoicus DSM 7310 TaxID=1123245 RepID=A0A974BHG8_SEDHY|nr:ABC transporter permease [Sedimentibacter hydroxybenzoicus]NYB73006.1 ABC transporter permease [Sedimentibacter hydroxybenzoicus DSM 7310]